MKAPADVAGVAHNPAQAGAKAFNHQRVAGLGDNLDRVSAGGISFNGTLPGNTTTD